jgi:twitching motility two-component system response regulator PilH
VSKLVLVIEDDPDQRRLLERMLVGSGWRVATAPDGETGLGVARSSPPDAIVLDVMMPRLNGFQTCRQLKSDPSTAAIPVVICTSKDQPADQYWATEVGADAFLAKPIDIGRLLQMLERLTERA